MLSASYFCNIETLVREPLARKIGRYLFFLLPSADKKEIYGPAVLPT